MLDERKQQGGHMFRYLKPLAMAACAILVAFANRCPAEDKGASKPSFEEFALKPAGYGINGWKSVGFSSDSKTLIGAGGKSSVTLRGAKVSRRLVTYDLASPQKGAALIAEGEDVLPFFKAALDGKSILYARRSDDTKYSLVSSATKKEMRAFDTGGVAPEYGSAFTIAFSNDAKLFAASAWEYKSRDPLAWRADLAVWDVGSGRQRFRIARDDGVHQSLAFSADGKYLAVGGSDAEATDVTVFDVATTKRVWRQRTTADENVLAVAFSPDGKTLASGGFGKQIELWQSSTGERKATFGLEGPVITNVYSLAYSPDGNLLAAGVGSYNRGDLWGQLRVLNTASGERLATPWPEHPVPVRDVAFSPDGKWLAANSAEQLRVWRVGGRGAAKTEP